MTWNGSFSHIWRWRRPLAITAVSLCLGNQATTQYALCQSSDGPRFVLGGSRYDTASFFGRLQQIMEQIDPRTLLTSDTELERCQKLLADYKEAGTLPVGVDDEMMWEAQRTVKAIIHGPTGEKMFMPGRMSAFILMNVPTAAGMIIQGPRSTALAVFWQWANQTYNIINNYVNRAGPDVEYAALGQSYVMAVIASVSIAFGAGVLLKRKPQLKKFGPAIPYFAVITAGTTNLSFTRMDEIKNGINVSDSDGNVLGRSVSAGRLAVFKTVTTRSIFLPIIPILFPAVTTSVLVNAGIIAASSPAGIAVQLAVITASMAVALPAALAILPEIMEIPVDSLEEDFHGLVDKNGNPITIVYASKGL